MVIKFKAVLLGITALAIAGSAVADDQFYTNQNNSSAYIGGNVGYGKVDEKVAGAPKQDNSGVAGILNAGYQFNQYFALEAGAIRNPDQDYGKIVGARIKGKDNYAGYAAVKGMIPVNPSFDLFGKVGIAAVHHKISLDIPGLGDLSSSKTKPAALLAVGAEYMLTPQVGFNVQALTTTKTKPVPATYSGTIGLSYHFS